MTDDAFGEQLREAGLRVTQSRLMVLQLLTQRNGPTSHGEVNELLDGVNRATLYRVLVDLTEAGLLRRVDLGDHVWRFERIDAPDHHDGAHPHFLCTACGEVSCLPELSLPTKGLPRAIAAGEVEIQLRGLCDDCFE